MENRYGKHRLTSFVAACSALTVSAFIAVAPAAQANELPVPYTFLSGAVSLLTNPGAGLPGANNWDCSPTERHPRPVVLLHGTFGGSKTNWATYGPLLHNEGYCVYTMTYGAIPGIGAPLDQLGGLQDMEAVSIPQAAEFVTRVLETTGASQADIIGHSQGTVIAAYLAKHLLPGKIHTVVGLAPLYKATGGAAMKAFRDSPLGIASGSLEAAVPSAAGLIEGSDAFSKLRAPDNSPYAPGVQYTNIATQYDEAVIPYTIGLEPGPGASNYVLQNGCSQDYSEHAAIASDPRAADLALNALDPANPRALRCHLTLPVHGAVGAVPAT